MEHESVRDTNCNYIALYRLQRFRRGTGGHENKRTSENHPNYSMVEIGKNIEKSLCDLRKLTVTLSPKTIS